MGSYKNKMNVCHVKYVIKRANSFIWRHLRWSTTPWTTRRSWGIKGSYFNRRNSAKRHENNKSPSTNRKWRDGIRRVYEGEGNNNINEPTLRLTSNKTIEFLGLCLRLQGCWSDDHKVLIKTDSRLIEIHSTSFNENNYRWNCFVYVVRIRAIERAVCRMCARKTFKFNNSISFAIPNKRLFWKWKPNHFLWTITCP